MFRGRNDNRSLALRASIQCPRWDHFDEMAGTQEPIEGASVVHVEVESGTSVADLRSRMPRYHERSVKEPRMK